MASFDSYTAAEVTELVSKTGVAKGNMRLDKVFLSSVSAGCLLAFACGTALATNAAPWFQENAPGLIRTISALVFPYGLCMIILTGADLCTGSFMVRERERELFPFHLHFESRNKVRVLTKTTPTQFTTVAAAQCKLAWWKMLVHWFVTFWGNLAGSLFVVAIIFGCMRALLPSGVFPFQSQTPGHC